MSDPTAPHTYYLAVYPNDPDAAPVERTLKGEVIGDDTYRFVVDHLGGAVLEESTGTPPPAPGLPLALDAAGTLTLLALPSTAQAQVRAYCDVVNAYASDRVAVEITSTGW